MRARALLLVVVVLAVPGVARPVTVAAAPASEPAAPAPEPATASIAELGAAMAAGSTSSETLVRAYLRRIEVYDRGSPGLGAVLVVNPDALAQARALDVERADGRVRGPLHGVPVLVKANTDTVDLPTTAASRALAGSVPPDDAAAVARLRAAGAVVLGTTNLHEFARGLTTVSSQGGPTRNPVDPSRNPGGSSGGTAAAVAAGLAAAGTGTDSCGSIRWPAAATGLAGLRPTLGAVPIDGVVPLWPSTDVVGPLGRSVADVAAVHAVLAGTAPAALDAGALSGARLGVVRDLTPPGPIGDVVTAAAADLRTAGAQIVDVDLPPEVSGRLAIGALADEFGPALDGYLAGLGPDAPVSSLDEVLASGAYLPELERGLRAAAAVESLDTARHRDAVADAAVVRDGVRAALDAADLDALVHPTSAALPQPLGAPQPGPACHLSALAGLPALTVPAGRVEGLPVGVELLGRAGDDDRLLALGHAYEAATRHARPPVATPPLTGPRPTPVVATRLAGADRVATALAVSRDRFVDAATGPVADVPGSGPAGAVVLAATGGTADALVAGPLAAALGGPLLLTGGGALDERVADEVTRLLAPGGRVVLVGGEAVLAPGVAAALEGYAVERLAGGDRFATAVAVARDGLGTPQDVVLATGRDAPDALVAGAAAAALDAAVLLTEGPALPGPTAAYLDGVVGDRYAVGGPAAAADPTAVALVGAERTATAAAVASALFEGARAAGLAAADAPADALAGAAHVAGEPGPLLLTDGGELSGPARAWLDGARPGLEEVTVFGGETVLAPAVLDGLAPAVLGRPPGG